jgi:PEGA domain
MGSRYCAPLLLFIGLAFGATGCGTIMQGSRQQIAISSYPTGASVRVDTTAYGITPITVALRRKDHHIIQINLDGYQPFEITTARSTSGWVWGNIVFGGLIGLVVDASTGGMYKLTPEQVQATLSSGTAQITREKDVLFVSVVLQPAAGWEKIGMLIPAR